MACVKRVNENGGKKLHKQGLLLLILLLPFSVFAQDLSKHNWYFGNSANGIRFNRGTNVAQPVTNQATPFGQGGAAVATDPATANLLFYTDGIRVYDATHTIMPNGTGLNALANTNQPVAICPMPGQANRWYIFTNTATFTTGGSISRSAVDMNQFGNAVFPAPALGVVEAAKNVAVPLLTNRSEAMIIVPHENNIDFWLITHQNGSANFSVTRIDATATFPTTLFTPPTNPAVIFPHSAANFAYHEPTGKLAVSPQSPNINAYILNFNNATGALSFDRTIFNSAVSATNNQAIYDIEWDNQGRYLYLSVHGDTGIPANVFQYDYQNPAITLAPVINPVIFRSYGLQVAPDSAIYHLYQEVLNGPFLAGRLTNTDTIASEVINTQSLFGGSNFNGTQFPSFKPRDSVELQVSFIAQGTCQNSPTSFFPTVLPNADSLNWDFGDGSGSNNWSPVYTYAAAGTFNVTLTAFYRGQTESTTQPVTINPFALTLQLVQDTTACRDEFPPPRGTATAATQFRVTVQVQGGTPVSTIWSNGDIGPTLTPDSAGYYYVVVTDATGCSAYAGVNVKEYGLQDQRSNVWHFGNTAGIDFNETPPVALDNSAMDAPEGCAIVCDRNGDVIFYTDGDKVFDKTDTEIDSGIGGDPASSQSAIIVPVPGDETLYYIFTTQAVNGTGLFEVRYSLFDLKLGLNGGLQQKNVLLFSRSTERITANERWVIVHEYGNNVFRSYPISADGIGQPVYSEIGSDHSFQSAVNAEGYMNLGSGNQIAVTLSTPGISNFVELFVLDDSTGVLSNFRQIDLNEPNGQVYGVEFSPGGNKIFATVKGSPTPSAIFEYYLDSLSRPVFKQRIDQNLELGAIQIGPDGQIYVAINGSNTLGIIQAVEDTTQFSTFNPSGFALLGGTNSRLGLPNFIDQNSNAFGGPGFTVAGACLGDTTIFEGVATDAIDNFLWSFGDGGTSTEDSTSHVYAAAGVYTVSMRLTNRCGLDTTIVRQVEIFAPPAPPSIPGAIALCTGAVTLDANIPNTPGIRHTWSNGATTQTVTLNNPASISVTNTSVNGCTSTAQTIVVDNRPPVDLGPDLTICEDDNSITILNAQNPGATYQWTINGVNASTIQTQGVDVTTPGIFTYEVTVTDPFTTCFTVEDKVITINVSPAVTLSQTDPTSCGTPDGTITLQLNPSVPPAGPYSYSLTGPNSFLQQDADLNAPSTIPFTGLEAGTYSAFVRDQISNCPSSPSIFLADVTLTITPTVTDPCIVAYSVTVAGGTGPYQFTLTDSGTGQVFGPSLPSTSPFLTTAIAPTLPAGNYILEVEDASGCIDAQNIAVTPNPPVTFTVDASDLCDATPSLTASGTATTYAWSTNVPGSIVGATNGATIQLLPGAGVVTFTVTGSGPAGCPFTQDVTIDVPATIVPTFTQSDACADQVILTAQPSGSFTYRWYANGSATPTALGQSISLSFADDGDSYVLEVLSTVTGCVIRSAPQTVSVVGLITAGLTGTPACDDNQPFTLTATTNTTGETYTWFRDNVLITGQNTATINQTAAGIYRVEISKSGCMTPAQIQVIKLPLPQGNLPDRVIICNDPDNADPETSTVDLDPGAFQTYDWFKNELSLAYTDRVLTADSEGFYDVDVTNSFGCISRDRTEVINDCIPKIVAPNAFRPTSGVSDNKDFFAYTFFITDNFQVLIYNRWGELVFESKDKNFKWNGGYNNNTGQPLPPGTYAYVFKYESSFRPEKGTQEQRGGVVLIR